MANNNHTSSKTLEVKNEELENYFANTIIPQLFVDADLILRKFTPPAMKHFQLSQKHLGKNIDSVKDNIKYPTIIGNIQEVISTGEILEKEIQTTDGKWYQMNILPYIERKENRTNGVIMTFVEITQRIHNLRELEKLNSEHETLIFALSHDLRQPLSSLSLMGEVLQQAYDQQDSTKFNKYLIRYKNSVKTLRTLVDNFVEANHSEPKWEENVERINIESVVENVTTGLKSEHFTAANYSCDFQTSEILFSRNNLRSIVYNLLINAITYRQTNQKLQVQITTKKLENSILLQVRDNGMGIAKEAQERIFEKGERLHPSLEGTGMGLYIIKRMLETKGGRIRVESKPGEGSTFLVFFKDKPL